MCTVPGLIIAMFISAVIAGFLIVVMNQYVIINILDKIQQEKTK